MTFLRKIPELSSLLAIGMATALAAAPLTAVAAAPPHRAVAGTRSGPTIPTHPGPKNDDYFIGANYFGGWKSGPNFHFDYANGTDWRPDHPELEPKYGWYDDSQPVMDQQIKDASANGLDYFVFDWYPERPTINDGGDLGGLHTGMNLFRTSAEKNRMKFMVNYIDGGPFNIGALRTPGMTQAQYEAVRAAEWDTITTKWVQLFSDPSYVTIDGSPVIEIYDVQRFTTDFSTGTRSGLSPHELAKIPEERAVMRAAVDVLKAKAAAAGFPDVIIGGGLQQPGWSGEYVNAHDYDGLYDFFTAYAWHDMKRVPAADNSYYNLIRDNHDYVWNYFAKYKNPAADYVPVITQGWNNIVHPDYPKWSIDKTPEAFGNSLREARAYLDQHPQTNLSTGSSIKMAIIGSWNELFEGHYFIPTKADGDAYTSQVGRVFGATDTGAAASARAANLVDVVTAYLSRLDRRLADTPVSSDEHATLTSAKAPAQQIVAALDAPASLTQALTKVAPLVNALPGALRGTALSSGDLGPVQRAWSSLVEAAFGLTVTASSSDYSATHGESVSLGVDVQGSAPVSNLAWKVRFPSTWPTADIQLAGNHQNTTTVVPQAVGDGTLYNVSDMFPGPSDMIGNRQDLSVDYTFTVGGVDVSGSVPLPLTVIRDLSSRIIRNGFDGTTNRHSVWIHNQTDRSISGTLALASVPGVTATADTSAVTLAPDERREIPVTFVNETGADAQIAATFTCEGRTVLLGTAAVSPKEMSVTTVPTLDGTVRSDGIAEVNNIKGRLQVGNAARADGTNTEYRPIVSFDLTRLAGGVVTRVMLDLTEFESGNPSGVVIEHLNPLTTLSAANFSAAARATAPFPIEGAPAAPGTHRQVDVTSWVQADLAAGQTLSTFRLRLAVVAPATTSYRAFRPTEYTSADDSDAPQLKVVFAP
ncbi:hypothetical protein JOF29_007049 [Kribbella aluminosa]|uniref:Glycosyl hydrolase family 99 n=1 Tax=Kribbella aluminosa TaxID=416017 RepID=A0ABS4UWB5_9ACTN|nr:glycoside hydrolase family 99-like domain-containing protein [Kribbella aluminosa]MBP2355939.1 hypothetical protein [Kribbella aluminosa]